MLGVPSARTLSTRPPRGRLCDVDGCPTILSTYNPEDVCWLHARTEFRLAPRRSRPPQRIGISTSVRNSDGSRTSAGPFR